MRPLLGLTLLFTACAPSREGAECASNGEWDCDASGDIWYCDEGAWSSTGPSDTGSETCTCEPGGQMACATPGFVGLDRAGRNRKAARRLRRA